MHFSGASLNRSLTSLQGVPFERARYWSQLAPHPLLQHVTQSAAGGELLVQAALGVASLAYLLDHKVLYSSVAVDDTVWIVKDFETHESCCRHVSR